VAKKPAAKLSKGPKRSKKGGVQFASVMKKCAADRLSLQIMKRSSGTSKHPKPLLMGPMTTPQIQIMREAMITANRATMGIDEPLPVNHPG
jgi:hypothetical protein